MEILFIYNIALTILLTIVSTGFYIIYVRDRKKELLYLSLLYFLLIIDNSIIYIAEFSIDFGIIYETSDILYTFILMIYIGVIWMIRMINYYQFDDKYTPIERWLAIIISITLLILFIFAPIRISEFVNMFAYLSSIIYMTLRVYKNIKQQHTDTINEETTKKYRVYLYIILVASVIGIVDNGIYFMEYYDEVSSSFTTLSYRTISFEVIKLLVCIIGIRKLYSSLESIFSSKEDVMPKSKSKKLDDFCIKYAMTTRQKEIIELIIEGYTNKEIGDRLHIVEGTVKVHTYNIFKKTETSNRAELIKEVLID